MNKTELEALSKLPFEQTLEKLEAAVNKMESGNLPLEEMMKTFEEGQTLAAICEKKLKIVEKKIEILKKKTDDNAEWVSFENEPTNTRNVPAQTAPKEQEEDLLF